MSEKSENGNKRKFDPHSMFWVVLVLLIAAGVEAYAINPPAPSVALRSMAVYRLEVGLAVAVGAYSVVMLLWLSYQGRWVKIPTPVGPPPEPGGGIDDELDNASEQIGEFEIYARDRFKQLDEALLKLEDRLIDLERSKPSQSKTGSE